MASKPPRKKKLDPRKLVDAAHYGPAAKAEALLAAGADPNAPLVLFNSPPGYTPLYMACLHAKVPIVRMLLTAGADPNLDGPSAPLLAAVGSKSKRTVEMVRMLLAAGARPNPPAYDGKRLIAWCRGEPRLDEVRELLEAAQTTKQQPARKRG